MPSPIQFRPGWGSVFLALGMGACVGFVAGLQKGKDSRTAAVAFPGGGTPAGNSSGLPSAAQGAPGKFSGMGGMPDDVGKSAATVAGTRQASLKSILEIKDPVSRLAALREMMRTLPPEALPAVLEELRQFAKSQQDLDSAGSLGLVLQSAETMADALLARGPKESMAMILDMMNGAADTEISGGLMTLMFGKWAEQDPLAAKDWILGDMSEVPEAAASRKEFAGNLVRAWVKKDPAAALSWIAGRPEEESRDLVAPAFQTLSHVDSAKAAALLAERKDLPGRDKVAAEMAAWWAKSEPAKALAWAAGLDEAPARAAAASTMETWAENDFAAARKGLSELSGELRDGSLPSLMAHWPAEELKEAAAFLQAEPAGTGRREASGKLMAEWAGKDQEAASAWLASQPAGEDRDAGAIALADSIRAADPEAAGIWLSTVRDETVRRQGLRETLDTWHKQSPGAAMRWLESSPQLSSPDREALLQHFRQP